MKNEDNEAQAYDRIKRELGMDEEEAKREIE